MNQTYERVQYRDLGGDYFVRNNKQLQAERLARRIRSLGYNVELKELAA